MLNRFTFSDLGYGIKLSDGKTDIFLQGEYADNFLKEVDMLKELWEKGNPNPKVFPSYDFHLAFLIEPYFYD